MIRTHELGLSLAFILWTITLVYRYSILDPTAAQDLFLAIAIEVWLISSHGSSTDGTWRLLQWHVVALSILHIAFWIHNKRGSPERRSSVQPVKQDHPPWAKPSIIPSRTNHFRFFPKKHSFSYSYLLIGVPVGWTGRAGRWLSVDSPQKAPFSVRASDFLERDHAGFELRQKLDSYLRNQAIDPIRFPYAYLITAPRVLGYSFNPASFWYLYSADQSLQAMVVEVNNTFDEKRLYYLERDSSARHFSQHWGKDFHVSPFNDRAGSYSLVAHDPLLKSSGSAMPLEVSNTITLKDANGDAKLVARIFSTEPLLDATAISLSDSLRLLTRYCWVGFVTFPRILREAWKLYFRRALDVFYRPEVVRGSIGRSPSASEKRLEVFFRQFLEDYVARSELVLDYHPAQGLGLDFLYRFGSSKLDVDSSRHIHLEVLSPVFYPRVMCALDTTEAILYESRSDDESNRTAYISNAELLQELFLSAPKAHPKKSYQDIKLSALDKLRWSFTTSLRPEAWTGTSMSEHARTAEADGDIGKDQQAETDLRGPNVSPRAAAWQHVSARMSMLDRHVVRSSSRSWLYRRLVTEQLLADRVIFGITSIITFADLLIRGLMIWHAFSSLRPMDPLTGSTRQIMLDFVAKLTLLSSIHLRSFVIGLR